MLLPIFAWIMMLVLHHHYFHRQEQQERFPQTEVVKNLDLRSSRSVPPRLGLVNHESPFLGLERNAMPAFSVSSEPIKICSADVRDTIFIRSYVFFYVFASVKRGQSAYAEFKKR